MRYLGTVCFVYMKLLYPRRILCDPGRAYLVARAVASLEEWHVPTRSNNAIQLGSLIVYSGLVER